VRIRIEGLQAIAMAELLIRIKPHIQSAAEQGALITVTEAQVRIRRLPVNAGAAAEALRSR
jgi:hypothetical protein